MYGIAALNQLNTKIRHDSVTETCVEILPVYKHVNLHVCVFPLTESQIVDDCYDVSASNTLQCLL